MMTLTQLFVVAAVLVGVLTSITVWAPRRLALKLAAFAVAWLFLPVAYAGLLDLLSRPKPATLEWWLRRAEEATVLGSRTAEGDAIYVWLQLDGVREPRAYALPWNRDLAEQLQAARREAEQGRGELRLRLPFESSLEDRRPRFYALPQPALPPKDEPGPPGVPAPERGEQPSRPAPPAGIDSKAPLTEA